MVKSRLLLSEMQQQKRRQNSTGDRDAPAASAAPSELCALHFISAFYIGAAPTGMARVFSDVRQGLGAVNSAHEFFGRF
jgi:hypothetical protein